MANLNFNIGKGHPLYPVMLALIGLFLLFVLYNIGQSAWRFAQPYEGEVVEVETGRNWLGYFDTRSRYDEPRQLRERRRQAFWLHIETPEGRMERRRVSRTAVSRVEEGDYIKKRRWRRDPMVVAAP